MSYPKIGCRMLSATFRPQRFVRETVRRKFNWRRYSKVRITPPPPPALGLFLVISRTQKTVRKRRFEVQPRSTSGLSPILSLGLRVWQRTPGQVWMECS